MSRGLTGRVLAHIVSLVGTGLFVWGMFGVGDTDKHLRREIRLQQAIIDHHRSGHGSEIIAWVEEDLEKHRAAGNADLSSDSVILNVACIVFGMLLFDIPRRRIENRRTDETGAAGR